MSEMKIALCLSGQPRYFKSGYEQIKKVILDVYDVDCFVHTWWDSSFENTQMEFSPQLTYGRKYVWEKDTLELIKNLYSPKKILSEKQIEFKTFDWCNYGLCTPMNLHSMFYSIMMSNNLKKKYEESENFKYDVVIRCRFDINFKNYKLNLNTIDLDRLNAFTIRPSPLGYPIINDQFAVSSSQIMDIYSDVYTNLEKYSTSNEFGAFVGEGVLSHHLYNNNVKFYSLGNTADSPTSPNAIISILMK